MRVDIDSGEKIEEQIWAALELDMVDNEFNNEPDGMSPTFTYSCPSVGSCNTAACSTKSNTSCSCG